MFKVDPTEVILLLKEQMQRLENKLDLIEVTFKKKIEEFEQKFAKLIELADKVNFYYFLKKKILKIKLFLKRF